jgi:hypothetical protein
MRVTCIVETPALFELGVIHFGISASHGDPASAVTPCHPFMTSCHPTI